MAEVLQTNIFFIITSAAVVIVTTLLVIALVYAIRVIRDLSHISQIVRKEGQEIVEDVTRLRNDIKSQALGWKGTLMFLLKRFAPKKKAAKKTNTQNDKQ